MPTFVLRRLLRLVPLLFGIVTFTFLLLQIAPGDFLSAAMDNPSFSPGAVDA